MPEKRIWREYRSKYIWGSRIENQVYKYASMPVCQDAKMPRWRIEDRHIRSSILHLLPSWSGGCSDQNFSTALELHLIAALNGGRGHAGPRADGRADGRAFAAAGDAADDGA